MKRMLTAALAAGAVAVGALAGAGGAAAAESYAYCINGKYRDVPEAQIADPAYKGATPANYYQGIGLTCDAAPVGWVFTPNALVNGSGDDLGAVSGDRKRIYKFARPVRAGYCNGGIFLNLMLGQPAVTPAYARVTPASYFRGIGITCSPLPAGYAYTGAFVNSGGFAGGTTDPLSIYRYATRP